MNFKHGLEMPGAFQIAMYKGTRPGLPGIYNRAVRAWERGPYSHAEIIFSDGIAASSSLEDGGVRFKKIEFDATRWDFYLMPNSAEINARKWFEDQEGCKYDLMGNVNQIIGFIPDTKTKYFCSESIAAALGIPDAWRFGPNSLASIVSHISSCAR